MTTFEFGHIFPSNIARKSPDDGSGRLNGRNGKLTELAVVILAQGVNFRERSSLITHCQRGKVKREMD